MKRILVGILSVVLWPGGLRRPGFAPATRTSGRTSFSVRPVLRGPDSAGTSNAGSSCPSGTGRRRHRRSGFRTSGWGFARRLRFAVLDSAKPVLDGSGQHSSSRDAVSRRSFADRLLPRGIPATTSRQLRTDHCRPIRRYDRRPPGDPARRRSRRHGLGDQRGRIGKGRPMSGRTGRGSVDPHGVRILGKV